MISLYFPTFSRQYPEQAEMGHYFRFAAQFAAHLRLLWLQKNSLIRGSEG
jgi:hypothetical protein